MKKLLMLFALVACVVSAQAAAVKWSTGTGLIAAGKTTDYASGTLYLIDAATISQGDLLTAFTKGTLNVGNYDVASGTLDASGKITSQRLSPINDATGAAYSAPQNVNFYCVLESGKNIFISDSKSVALATSGEAGLSFMLKSQSNSGDISTGAFSEGGWYTAKETIPEPTSGLLMLVGASLLALRRRRA